MSSLTTGTERLIEPAQGHNLIRRGDSTLTRREYVQLAARKQLPALFRFHPVVHIYEHRIAPCEDHVMVPRGEVRMSTRDIRKVLVPEWRWPTVPWKHTHKLHNSLEWTGVWRWDCVLPGCGQHGLHDYDESSITIAEGLIYYQCVKCGETRAFPAIRGGAPNTFYVDWNNGSDSTGDGTSGNPWKKYEKARSSGSIVAGNADIVRGRSGTYVESFDSTHQWQAGTSYADALTITKDTGQTPILAPGTSVNAIIWFTGISKKYTIVDGLTFDCSSIVGPAVRVSADSNTAATGANHIRTTGIECYSMNADTGYWSTSCGTNNEILNSVFRNTVDGIKTVIHATYPQAADVLIQGNEMHTWSPTNTQWGYGAHGYNGGLADGNCDRMVCRRNRFHGGRSTGVRAGTSDDALVYYNWIYDNNSGGGFGGIYVTAGANACNVLNNTICNNAEGGIRIESGCTNTVVKNNICLNNSGTPGNFQDLGTGTTTSNNMQFGTSPVSSPASFADQAGRDYSLTTSSNARNAGTSVSATINSGTYPQSPPVDFFGTTVPQESAPDVGGYELISPTPYLGTRGRLR